MQELQYLLGYPDHLTNQVQEMIANNTLADLLLKKYPSVHGICTDKALYDYVITIKNAFMHKTQHLSKVLFDSKIQMKNQALGVHKFVSRVQGKKLKAKNEIRIPSTFRKGPEPFLRMIVVHELAHLKEKDHNKAFFKLCIHMEPAYQQLEFDMRFYLTQRDLFRSGKPRGGL
ncbi:MAG: YgjP-like metallopeptidase domain-containing protein [Desulforhopalus sp.]